MVAVAISPSQRSPLRGVGKPFQVVFAPSGPLKRQLETGHVVYFELVIGRFTGVRLCLFMPFIPTTLNGPSPLNYFHPFTLSRRISLGGVPSGLNANLITSGLCISTWLTNDEATRKMAKFGAEDGRK